MWGQLQKKWDENVPDNNLKHLVELQESWEVREVHGLNLETYSKTLLQIFVNEIGI